MSNLNPEKRINKNGVAVTKHVKPQTLTASHRLLPAPREATRKFPVTKNEYVKEIARFLFDGASDIDRHIAASIYTSAFGTQSLRQVYEYTQNMDPDDEYSAEAFEVGLTRIAQTAGDSKVSMFLRNDMVGALLASSNVMGRFCEAPHNSERSFGVICLATESARLNKINLKAEHISEENQLLSQYLALEAIAGKRPETYDRDELRREAQFFDENFEKLVPHAKTICQRQRTDSVFLSQLLDETISSSLLDGLI